MRGRARPPHIEVDGPDHGLRQPRADASDLTFTIRRGDIFVIMGGSGCGKSTLLRHLVGLQRPARATSCYDGVSFWDAEPEERSACCSAGSACSTRGRACGAR